MPRCFVTIVVIAGWVAAPIGVAQVPDSYPSTNLPEPAYSTVAPIPERTASRSSPVVNERSTIAAPFVAAPPGSPFEPAETIAQVGNQYILKGELIGEANLMLAPSVKQLEKLGATEREQAERQLREMRDQLIQGQLLPRAIERKLMYGEFLRSIPPGAEQKKIDEQQRVMQKKVDAEFDKQLQEMCLKVRDAAQDKLAELAKQGQIFYIAHAMRLNNIEFGQTAALDRMLRQYDTSLFKQQQSFKERLLGQSAVRNKVNFQPEITHDEMVAYYREHSGEFHVPTRAQWEQMTVVRRRFPAGEPGEIQMWDAIVAMGNHVVFGGAPFWAVAKRQSQDKFAEKGGFHDWTAFGDLKNSNEINEAVFSLPLHQMSQVIQDPEGLHIIRVLDRVEAHQIPFTEAQVDIKKKLENEQFQKAFADYVVKLRERTPVSTAFDPPATASRGERR